MNVLIVGTGFPNDKSLCGIFEYDQAKALAQIGHKVIYVGIDLHSLRKKRKLGFYYKRVDDISVYTVDLPIGRLPIRWLMKIASVSLRMVYKGIEKREGKPSIVHAHFGYMCGYAAGVLCNNEGIPLVITEHSSMVNREQLTLKESNLLLQIYGRAKKVIAVSQKLSNNIFKHTGIKTIVIPNMVDAKEFIYEPVLHDTFNFVSVGNLIPLKRMSILIEAFSRAFPKKESVSLSIYGSGKEYGILKNKITDLREDNRISLKGRKLRAEIAKDYHLADCFVLASSSETFGVSYIEALASGLPVIATKCGGPEDFVSDFNGILIHVDDMKALEDAMRLIISQQYNNRLIAEKTRELFSPEIIARKIASIYEDILFTPNLGY